MSLTDTERAHIQETLQKQKDALAALRFTGSPEQVGQGLLQLAELHGLLEDHAASRKHYEAQILMQDRQEPDAIVTRDRAAMDVQPGQRIEGPPPEQGIEGIFAKRLGC